MRKIKIDAPCPCNSDFPLASCCAPYIGGIGLPATALSTMRSRYCAHVLGNVRYLLDTWHPRTRPAQIPIESTRRWLGLDVKDVQAGEAGDIHGSVEFVARFKVAGRAHRLHELSQFKFDNGRWFYVDGELF